nr:MAG TPA: hypothetical protein [Caudoviricetes sp.]
MKQENEVAVKALKRRLFESKEAFEKRIQNEVEKLDSPIVKQISITRKKNSKHVYIVVILYTYEEYKNIPEENTDIELILSSICIN